MIALSMGVAAALGMATPRPAQAQRPFRLLLGLSAPKEHQTFAAPYVSPFAEQRSERSSAGVLHLAYDLPKRQQISNLPPLILSAYYDYASYVEDVPSYSVSGVFATFPTTRSVAVYQGFGAMLRAPYSWGYAGAGLGLYNGSVGGKIFTGLQGRGSLFLELSWTLLARPNAVGNPYPVFGVGLRL